MTGEFSLDRLLVRGDCGGVAVLALGNGTVIDSRLPPEEGFGRMILAAEGAMGDSLVDKGEALSLLPSLCGISTCVLGDGRGDGFLSMEGSNGEGGATNCIGGMRFGLGSTGNIRMDFDLRFVSWSSSISDLSEVLLTDLLEGSL